MDKEFTDKIKSWLDTPAKSRDYAEGAMMLLKLNLNRIMYANLMRNLKANKDVIEYNLRKYYDFRKDDPTDETLKAEAEQAAQIIDKNLSKAKRADEGHIGRRDDHEDLPPEIKAMYEQNLDLLHEMRELHLQMRMLDDDNNVDRRPIVKKIIELDKRLHRNWQIYDEANIINLEVSAPAG